MRGRAEPAPGGGSSGVRPPVDGLQRRELFGLQFVDAIGLEPVLEAALDRADDDGPDLLPLVFTPNVDIIVHLDEGADPLERELAERSQFVLPDGMPIVVASRILGRPLRARLTGSGLMAELWPRLRDERRRVLAVTASPVIAARLADDAPLARCFTPPMIHLGDDVSVTAVVDDLVRLAVQERPEFVLFGLGHPKDLLLAHQFLERWPVALGRRPLCCCLGGSFAMYTGLRRRAPVWVQRIGLEWLYRFGQEPRRLFHRYFIRDPRFVSILARELMAIRRRNAHRRPG